MKLNQLIILLTLLTLLAPYSSFAQYVYSPEVLPEPDIPTRLFSCSPNDTLRRCMLKLLGDLLRVILVVALIFSALSIAWAGITYISGGTDDKKREAAKNRLIYAAIGLIFAFLSWVLVTIFTRIIGGGRI
ncbi:MAG: hypothetical protein KatS3mg096_045 [Candidatus Parcubacteria bacterium]|nr:MAG: hypothetical protein KatS3mg096_045 [Candidatus Parcubacteria bacterium]